MMSRLRKLCLTAGLLTVLAAPALAQNPPAGQGAAQPAAQAPATTLTFPTFEVTGAYQFLHAPDQNFPFGLNLDGAWNASSAFGVVGEVGWAVDSEDDVTLHAWNIGVGPRWNARPDGRIWPFAQVLVGALHARASAEIAGEDFSDSRTKFMVQPGVGVNFIGGDGWGIVGAVDYRRVFLDEEEDGESGENEFRVLVGLRVLLD